MKVACIGEAMVELSLSGDGASAGVGFAGDTLNTAVYLKRGAPKLDVAFVTRLGTDAFSGKLRDFVAGQGVDTGGIETSATRRVGLYAITTDATGERSFTYWRDSSAAREMFQADTDGAADFARLAGYDVLYLSAITLAIWPERVRSEFYNWAAGFRAGGGRIAFDSNYRPALWTSPDVARSTIADYWRITDIALPSVDDEMSIFGDSSAEEVAARMRGYGVGGGALKCGPVGPVSLGDFVAEAYPEARNVLDTTAAGDSFNGGYLAAHLTGASQANALRAGHDLAARVVQHKGAIIPAGA